MKRKIMVIIFTLGLTFCMSACSGNAQASGDESSDYIDDVVQHMDPEAIEGSYMDTVSQRASMEIVFNDMEEYYEVLIQWGSSAWDTTQWSMTAYDDDGDFYMDYTDCVCSNLHFDDEKEQPDIEPVYEHGAGSFLVNDDGTISWKDDNGEDHLFEKIVN